VVTNAAVAEAFLTEGVLAAGDAKAFSLHAFRPVRRKWQLALAQAGLFAALGVIDALHSGTQIYHARVR
jgi:hypothetical protein